MQNRILRAVFVVATAYGVSLLGAGNAHSATELGTCEKIEQGEASWYGPGFRGKLMANGKPFDPDVVQIAHKTLPLGTKVKIQMTDAANAIHAVVTDRGPFHGGQLVTKVDSKGRKVKVYEGGRNVDLSDAAIKKLGATNGISGAVPTDLKKHGVVKINLFECL